MALTNVTFSSSASTGYGGCVFAGNYLTLQQGAFSGCASQQSGGAVFAANNVALDAVTVSGASAALSGGAVFVASNVAISNSAFTNTTAGNGGGAVFGVANLAVVNTIFSNTTAQLARPPRLACTDSFRPSVACLDALGTLLARNWHAVGSVLVCNSVVATVPLSRRAPAVECTRRRSRSRTARSSPPWRRRDLAAGSTSRDRRATCPTPRLPPAPRIRSGRPPSCWPQAQPHVTDALTLFLAVPFPNTRARLQDGGGIFAATGSVLGIVTSRFISCNALNVRKCPRQHEAMIDSSAEKGVRIAAYVLMTRNRLGRAGSRRGDRQRPARHRLREPACRDTDLVDILL